MNEREAVYTSLVPGKRRLAAPLGAQPDRGDGEELFDKAAAALRRMLAVEPRNAAALARLGDVERRRGDFAAALTSCRRLLAVAPDDAAAAWAVAVLGGDRLLLHDAGRAGGGRLQTPSSRSAREERRPRGRGPAAECWHEITPVACSAEFGDGRFAVNGWILPRVWSGADEGR